MNLLGYINPKQLWIALTDINDAHPSYMLPKDAAMKRIVQVLVIVAVSLLLVEYLKLSRVFREFINVFEYLGLLPSGNQSLVFSDFYSLYTCVWWTLWPFIAYILIPWIGVKFIIKDKFSNYGWRWADTSSHWGGYLVLAIPMTIGVIVVSFSDRFAHFYPFYSDASRSWFDLLLWECLYLFQFICVEFFFRGFILHALRPALGANAIFVMCIPYMMVHFSKPMLESTVAFCFGVFLGVLSLRSLSIWGGVILHVIVALAMDLTAMSQRGALPETWWPIF